MAAKTSAELAQEFAQGALAASPVIILGSGASAAHGVPGMGQLATHLRLLSIPSDWTGGEQTEWGEFARQLDAGADLESALLAVRLSERQTNFVAENTRSFLLPSDLAAFQELLTNRRTFPLTRLFRHLFSSTYRTVNVITPNYDRLAEYAADAGDFSAFTGFSYGHLQTRARHSGARIQYGREEARTVCVWKVHGSLDWFRDKDGQIVGAPSLAQTPAGYAPLLITPGIDKYRLTHAEPFRTIFGCSDAALEGARSYLAVGYGFNDEHLQTKLVERCDLNSVPLVVVTKALSDTAKAFLQGGRCRRYLALEETPSGTRAYTHDEPAGFEILGEQIWRLDKFLDMAIGEDL